MFESTVSLWPFALCLFSMLFRIIQTRDRWRYFFAFTLLHFTIFTYLTFLLLSLGGKEPLEFYLWKDPWDGLLAWIYITCLFDMIRWMFLGMPMDSTQKDLPWSWWDPYAIADRVMAHPDEPEK